MHHRQTGSLAGPNETRVRKHHEDEIGVDRLDRGGDDQRIVKGEAVVARETERVFGDVAKARRWLSADNRILGGRPLDLLATDAGARDVEYELVRIDHGDLA